ncbi:hypothetical protein LTR37_007949 [Vermiconidia calcicola]|uniref:Uncharacterized protein n=1 Tax=Vermiconidia calcicola TaxID=1690605 RepID=A0ACC3NBY0_9PEZI|nr:hypothetical protein LTR37_007949 [Vermiconidia calcicola]
MATPTVDSAPKSTAAAPSSTAKKPFAESTATATTNVLDPAGSVSEDHGDKPYESHVGRPHKTAVAQTVNPLLPTVDSPTNNKRPPPATRTGLNTEQNEAPVTGAVLSIFAEALSSSLSVGPDSSLDLEASASHTVANSLLDESPDRPDQSPSADPSATGAVASINGTPYTAVKSGDSIVFGSETLEVGQATTVSGVRISVETSAVVLDDKTVALTARPAPSVGSGGMETVHFTTISEDRADTSTHLELPIGGTENIRFTTISEDPAHTSRHSEPNVVAVGSITLTGSIIAGHSTDAAIIISGHTLSIGGPPATISGHVISQASYGLILLDSEAPTPTEGSLPPIRTRFDFSGPKQVTYVKQDSFVVNWA